MIATLKYNPYAQRWEIWINGSIHFSCQSLEEAITQAMFSLGLVIEFKLVERS